MEPREIVHTAIPLTATYDLRLVFLSLVIAVISSYTALDMVGQTAITRGQARRLWLVGAAVAFGISIWVMHFISMLAYQLPILITYDFSVVLSSLVIAVASSGAGLFVVSRRSEANWLMLLAGSAFITLGIVGMHYIGMVGLRLAAVPVYDMKLVLLSDVLTFELALSALWLAFHATAKAIISETVRRIGSAILAGFAIDALHYTAMASVKFYPSFEGLTSASFGIDRSVLAIAIGTAGLSILMLASLASFFGQRLRTEIARAEALRESEERYQNLYDFTPDAYFSIAADGTIKSVNQLGAEALGYRKEELINSSFWFIVYEDDRAWFQQQVARIFNERLLITEVELRKVHKDSSIFWERQRSQLLLNEAGMPLELRMICRNITERKQAEDALRRNAFHDALTGLPNRALFMDRLEQASEYAKRHEDYLFALLFLDLDRFKVINDSLGHLLGDQLLIAIADRLKTCLRPTDTVARFGGDEFTILLEDIEGVSDTIRVADRVEEELKLPFDLGGQEVFTSASIGIALSSTGGYSSPESLLRDADIAMYRAKNQGSARYEIFNPEMHEQAMGLFQLETDLRNALERQEFRLQYQPIVSLSTGRIVGFEALIRLQHPKYGLQFPVEFIAAAEENGLITRICQWVIRTACIQLRTWQLQFPAIPLVISLNISGRQFTQPNLVTQINQVLQETALDASSLRLEITEGAIMSSADSAAAMLLQLRELGVQLSIDDFGTGYSSLGRLYHFPIDGLKIDRSFVSGSSFNERNLVIVETIVALGHTLGVDVTAEGVETAEQLAQLRALHCEYGQGHFFSRSLDSEAAEALIIANPQW